MVTWFLLKKLINNYCSFSSFLCPATPKRIVSKNVCFSARAEYFTIYWNQKGCCSGDMTLNPFHNASLFLIRLKVFLCYVDVHITALHLLVEMTKSYECINHVRSNLLHSYAKRQSTFLHIFLKNFIIYTPAVFFWEKNFVASAESMSLLMIAVHWLSLEKPRTIVIFHSCRPPQTGSILIWRLQI